MLKMSHDLPHKKNCLSKVGQNKAFIPQDHKSRPSGFTQQGKLKLYVVNLSTKYCSGWSRIVRNMEEDGKGLKMISLSLFQKIVDCIGKFFKIFVTIFVT